MAGSEGAKNSKCGASGVHSLVTAANRGSLCMERAVDGEKKKNTFGHLREEGNAGSLKTRN